MCCHFQSDEGRGGAFYTPSIPCMSGIIHTIITIQTSSNNQPLRSTCFGTWAGNIHCYEDTDAVLSDTLLLSSLSAAWKVFTDNLFSREYSTPHGSKLLSRNWELGLPLTRMKCSANSGIQRRAIICRNTSEIRSIVLVFQALDFGNEWLWQPFHCSGKPGDVTEVNQLKFILMRDRVEVLRSGLGGAIKPRDAKSA